MLEQVALFNLPIESHVALVPTDSIARTPAHRLGTGSFIIIKV